ncbi:hypothetical protein LPJ66_002581 [Kickxella alabastrina]|uniref:Uncharacterized protein n=1 Tax=Kickxella alabastrina TaxID=61397 RepID=A0ACC1IQ16_9FUNG|nr:hypothetical protein LPJ66_002581 [Kickxella alabastrina]
MMFTIGSDYSSSSSSSSSIASSFSSSLNDNNSVDDGKPNSIYGDSVRQATRDAFIPLQDLSPRSSSASGSAATFSNDVRDIGYLDTMAAVFGENVDGQYADQQMSSSSLEDNSAATGRDLFFPAECSVERAANSRGERYFYTVGAIEPGGGDSAARYAVGDDGRMSIAQRQETVVREQQKQQQQSFGSSSGSSMSNGTMPRMMQDMERGRRRGALVSASASADARKRNHAIALQSAADLQRELFPHGVPSQGVLKSGARHISADIKFRAIGCERRPWHGFIIDDVLFVYVSEFVASEGSFRTAVMALMELAEDVLGCASVICALPKALSTVSGGPVDTAAAATLVRAFMYSGFELVSQMLYQPSPAYVLVGYDAM